MASDLFLGGTYAITNITITSFFVSLGLFFQACSLHYKTIFDDMSKMVTQGEKDHRNMVFKLEESLIEAIEYHKRVKQLVQRQPAFSSNSIFTSFITWLEYSLFRVTSWVEQFSHNYPLASCTWLLAISKWKWWDSNNFLNDLIHQDHHIFLTRHAIGGQGARFQHNFPKFGRYNEYWQCFRLLLHWNADNRSVFQIWRHDLWIDMVQIPDASTKVFATRYSWCTSTVCLPGIQFDGSPFDDVYKSEIT